MTTPLLAPPEAQPQAEVPPPESTVATETMPRPFRLGVVGLGTAIGLTVRLLAANGFGELDSTLTMLGTAAASAVVGLGLLLMSAERDHFGAPLAWISIVTAVSWGALNWISPPFGPAVTVWSKPDQVVLAVLGLGNGLLLAGIIALTFVRRRPTLTVAALILASALVLGANTVVLRDEWPAIVATGLAFALVLLAWDRSPRRELAYTRPAEPPRVSRAALSFISVAMCGTAIQLWTSRTDIPRSLPAVVVCGLMILAAFASLIRVRREIEKRETALSEWTSWAREIRTNDFRAEMQNFESDGAPSVDFDARPVAQGDGQPPRPLSFPNLSIPDEPVAEAASEPASGLVPDGVPTADAPSVPGDVHLVADTAPVALPRISLPVADVEAEVRVAAEVDAPAPATTGGGVFSTILSSTPETAPAPAGVQIADLEALDSWLTSPVAAARTSPLLVAVEAMSLGEFESLPPQDAAVATSEIGSFLADTMADADLVSWIDGPYFIVAYAAKTNAELLALNQVVLKSLKGTDGTLAFVRPGPSADLSEVVDECVQGLLNARRARERARGD